MTINGKASYGNFKVDFKVNFKDLGKVISEGLIFGRKVKYINSSGEEVFPNKSLQGWGRTPRYKEAIINDIAVAYFEYSSGYLTGHSCQIEVISPKKYKNLRTKVHSSDSAGHARMVCIDELKKYINLS